MERAEALLRMGLEEASAESIRQVSASRVPNDHCGGCCKTELISTTVYLVFQIEVRFLMQPCASASMRVDITLDT